MHKIYITFSGKPYEETTRSVVEAAPRFGADRVLVYDDIWLLAQDFYHVNYWLWDHPHKRGCGWYAWKPFIILDAMKRAADGDVILYADADTVPIADLSPIYDTASCEEAMLFAASAWSNNSWWCKRDCFAVMGQDSPRYHECQHGVARFMAFTKGPWRPYQLLIEWLTYCLNPLANTFDPSILGRELPGFREHRAEQAILTLLAHKHGFKLYREADESGEGHGEDRELYGQLFSQRNLREHPNVTAPVEGSCFANVG